VLAIIGATLAVEMSAIVGENAIVRAIGLRTSDTEAAFMLGALVATTLLVLVGVVAVLSGGVNWITGSRAERWTDEALAALGPEWRALHNLAFTEGTPPDTWPVDVDHVAVGPYGVLVVESKFSTSPIDLDAERLSKQVRKDAAQVARNAVRVKRLLPPTASGVVVTSLLVYWGWRVPRPEHPFRAIGRSVQVVIGADASRWRPLFAARNIDREIQDAIWTSLLEHETPLSVQTDSLAEIAGGPLGVPTLAEQHGQVDVQ
jgi:hypothetical protein